MSLSPVRLRDGWLQPNRLSGGRIGGGGQSPRDAILATASPATLSYVQAVEAADGNIQLENAVLAAMVTFANYRIPLGGACCLMAGARTLAGALVPMVGAAPTEVNFVNGDYDRTTGLVGDGIGKYLDSNRNNNADGQDNRHACVYATTVPSGPYPMYIGTQGGVIAGVTNIYRNGSFIQSQFTSQTVDALFSGTPVTGFVGASRSSSLSFNSRVFSAAQSNTRTSQAPHSINYTIFSSNGFNYSNARLSYYSIGPAVDLTAMDTAITTCMSSLAAAGI